MMRNVFAALAYLATLALFGWFLYFAWLAANTYPPH